MITIYSDTVLIEKSKDKDLQAITLEDIISEEEKSIKKSNMIIISKDKNCKVLKDRYDWSSNIFNPIFPEYYLGNYVNQWTKKMSERKKFLNLF